MGDLETHPVLEMRRIARDEIAEVFRDQLHVDLKSADSLNELNKDLDFVRRWRKARDTIGLRLLVALALACLAFIVAKVWPSKG